MICWVTQEGNNDYSPAEEFGEVRFITRGDLRSMQGQQNEAVCQDIRKFLTEYIPGKDSIILAGNPMVGALVILSLRGPVHQLLKWDGRRAAYVPFQLESLK